jgi:hypothetical protein
MTLLLELIGNIYLLDLLWNLEKCLSRFYVSPLKYIYRYTLNQ